MNQAPEGIYRVVRVTRTPLSVVALGIIVPAVFSAVILLFAPIHEVAKYIFGGLPWVLVVVVWLQFWSKAKTEPLSASDHPTTGGFRKMLGSGWIRGQRSRN